MANQYTFAVSFPEFDDRKAGTAEWIALTECQAEKNLRLIVGDDAIIRLIRCERSQYA